MLILHTIATALDDGGRSEERHQGWMVGQDVVAAALLHKRLTPEGAVKTRVSWSARY